MRPTWAQHGGVEVEPLGHEAAVAPRLRDVCEVGRDLGGRLPAQARAPVRRRPPEGAAAGELAAPEGGVEERLAADFEARVAGPLQGPQQGEAGLGWLYLSNATCLIRPHLLHACFSVNDHHNLLQSSPLLHNACV